MDPPNIKLALASNMVRLESRLVNFIDWRNCTLTMFGLTGTPG
jgi:hypothetical protein